MSSITPLTFTGVSNFSSDLLTILNRAQQIAQLPLTALTQDQLEVQDQQTALKSVQVYAAQLSKYLTSVQDAAGSGALSPVSSSSQVTVSASSELEMGQHVITNIIQLASSTSTASASTYATTNATALTGGSNYLELWVGGESKTWSLAAEEDNLASVRDWINDSDLGVTASIISTDAGYVLSVSANASGAKEIELYTGPAKTGSNLLTTVATGKDLMFTIDGQAVQRSSNTVSDVVPGMQLVFNDTTTGAEQINISVQSTVGPLKVALAGLAATYNALQTELAKHIGKAGGVLTGDATVGAFRSSVGSLGTLATLDGTGLSFDENGLMQFDGSVLDNLSAAWRSSLMEQLTSGQGIVSQLAAHWEGLVDATAGLVATELSQLSKSNLRLTAQVSDLTERINRSQERLKAQLQAADALLASLESQQGMLTATLDSLSYVAYGKTVTKNSG